LLPKKIEDEAKRERESTRMWGGLEGIGGKEEEVVALLEAHKRRGGGRRAVCGLVGP
jgi:hypothetical protein